MADGSADTADDRNYYTIGEVLNVLKPEFPDVSISKLRFLESQGLVHPDRTASGYRKFTSDDIDKLRFVLREQRDRFLPLRVIKTRLEAWERGELDPDPEPQDGVLASPVVDGEASDFELAPAGVRLGADELAAASGLPADQVRDLEKFGLIEHYQDADATGENIYDECALVVAKIARGFMRYGIEARHLRMFAQSASREAALFEQVVSPMLAQKTPQSRRQAIESLTGLAALARKLHQALLAQNLSDHSEAQR